MRRWLAALVLLAACAPGLDSQYGFVNARAPTFGQVTIGGQPGFFGELPDSGAGWWNVAAGRPLFVRTDNSPQVTFEPGSIFITPPEAGSRRVVVYAAVLHNGDGTVNHCTVHYDPGWVAAIPGRYLVARLWAHELGHCLDLASHDNRTAVMGDGLFWQKVMGRYGPEPQDTSQLRAAGYIP